MLRLSKTELKRQKDVLKRYRRYLPMLHLKQQQLQISIQQVQAERARLGEEYKSFISSLSQWVAVFADDVELSEFIQLKEVLTDTGNIAGVDIPVYESCKFAIKHHDVFSPPFWLDKGVVVMQQIVEMKEHMNVLDRQITLLSDELKRTTQRVNLFEKVLIPETLSNIRVIQIMLSDQQTAAVVRGKLCKRKILEKSR